MQGKATMTVWGLMFLIERGIEVVAPVIWIVGGLLGLTALNLTLKISAAEERKNKILDIITSSLRAGE